MLIQIEKVSNKYNIYLSSFCRIFAEYQLYVNIKQYQDCKHAKIRFKINKEGVFIVVLFEQISPHE